MLDNLKVTEPDWAAVAESPSRPASVVADNGKIIADVYGESYEARKANSHMMAASLDLYQAVYRCVQGLEAISADQGRDVFLDTVIEAKAAMRKARGGK
jgi:uncharacterized protein YegP (UPF0339 family)